MKIKDMGVIFSAQAIVTENGNCYIRYRDLDEDYPLGFEKSKYYRTYAKYSDISNNNRFFELYSGGDAKKVFLSGNSVIIITDENKLLLFYSTEKYLDPEVFAEGVVEAKFVEKENRIYVVEEGGSFGYYFVEDNKTFVSIMENVISFERVGNIFAIHTKDNELIITDNSFTAEQLSHRLEDIIDYSLSQGTGANGMVVSYVTSDARCFYRQGFISMLQDFRDVEAYDQVAESVIQVAAFKKGMLYLDDDYNARIYGEDILSSDQFYQGALVAENVENIFANVSEMFILYKDGSYIFIGSAPDRTYVTISDILIDET